MKIAKVGLYWKKARAGGDFSTYEEAKARSLFTKWKYITFEGGRKKYTVTGPVILKSDKMKVI